MDYFIFVVGIFRLSCFTIVIGVQNSKGKFDFFPLQARVYVNYISINSFSVP